jgi:surface protein
MAALTALTDITSDNFNAAANDWKYYPVSAALMYIPISAWDVSSVTNMENSK